MGCINPHHFRVCPFDSPWHFEGVDLHNEVDQGPSLNLDKFMPLHNFVDLHQLKSNDSDQSGYTSYTDTPNVRACKPRDLE